jgi:hypothetical protein
MAITVTTLNTTNAVDCVVHATELWTLNATSADASGSEDILATPGASCQLVIVRLTVLIGAAITVTILADADVLIGPLGGAAGTYTVDCSNRPILLDANHKLACDASGAGDICIMVDGYTRGV